MVRIKSQGQIWKGGREGGGGGSGGGGVGVYFRHSRINVLQTKQSYNKSDNPKIKRLDHCNV